MYYCFEQYAYNISIITGDALDVDQAARALEAAAQKGYVLVHDLDRLADPLRHEDPALARGEVALPQQQVVVVHQPFFLLVAVLADHALPIPGVG